MLRNKIKLRSTKDVFRVSSALGSYNGKKVIETLCFTTHKSRNIHHQLKEDEEDLELANNKEFVNPILYSKIK